MASHSSILRPDEPSLQYGQLAITKVHVLSGKSRVKTPCYVAAIYMYRSIRIRFQISTRLRKRLRTASMPQDIALAWRSTGRGRLAAISFSKHEPHQDHS